MFFFYNKSLFYVKFNVDFKYFHHFVKIQFIIFVTIVDHTFDNQKTHIFNMGYFVFYHIILRIAF